MKNLSISEIISQGELCHKCLKPLSRAPSQTPHICAFCEHENELSNSLENAIKDFFKHNANFTFTKFFNIYYRDEIRYAKCPICGNRIKVIGYLFPQIECNICDAHFLQFNSIISVKDRRTSNEIDTFNTDDFNSYFNGDIKNGKKSCLF